MIERGASATTHVCYLHKMCIHAGATGIKECVGKNEGYTKEEEEEEEKNHVCFTH